MAFGVNPFFDTDIPLSAYSASQVGYGHLSPIGKSSEIGVMTEELLQCSDVPSPDKLSTEDKIAISVEAENVTFLINLIRQSQIKPINPEQQEFLEVLNDPKYFYNSPKGEKTKIKPSGSDSWNELSLHQRKLAEKFIYLQTKMLPSENLKAVILLEILKEKEGLTFSNMESLIKKSFFLINETYIRAATKYIRALHRKDEEAYSDYLEGFIKTPFYKIQKIADKTGRLAKREHKKSNSGNISEHFSEFMKVHRDTISDFIENLQNNPHQSFVRRQAFSEGLIESPVCDELIHKIECNGVQRNGEKTKIASNFSLEYFKAYRSLEIHETDTAFLVNVPLDFMLQSDLEVEQATALLLKWKNWAQDFYNTDHLIYNKKVMFNFEFTLTNKDSENTINLRKCWNASRSSSDCSLPSQADAKNLIADIKKDVLLEEVGHHMGLADEYQMPYYHFNPLGAADSFMVAPTNFKIYPHHLKGILAPHLICK